MKATADLCIIPLGVGLSLSPYIAACARVLASRGLVPHVHAYGTNIEGELSEVLAGIQACHEALHADGVPRITTTIKLGTRTDREQSLADKVTSVQTRLESRP